MKWISVKEKLPKKGQIVLVWLINADEPSCVKFDIDQHGPVWNDLVAVPIEMDREDRIAYWAEIEPPKDCC